MPSSKKLKTNPQSRQELDELRGIINQLDEQIIESIATRMVVSQTIGAVKKLNNLKIKDPERENELQKLHKELAKKYKVSPAALRKIFQLIFEESKKLQK